jgi:hypothetical protein
LDTHEEVYGHKTLLCIVTTLSILRERLTTMTIFNLGFLGRVEIRWSAIADQALPTGYTELPSGDVPPSYTVATMTDISTRLRMLPLREVRGPPLAQRPTCRTKQIRRYLIELIALTFNVDFNELNTALGCLEDTENTNSILTPDAHDDLVSLASSVRKMRLQIENNEISTISANEGLKFQYAIITPSTQIHDTHLAEFALDLIGWYTPDLPFPVPWSVTIPAHWGSNPKETRYW